MTETKRVTMAATVATAVAFFKNSDKKTDECLSLKNEIEYAEHKAREHAAKSAQGGNQGSSIFKTLLAIETGWGLFSLGAPNPAEEAGRAEGYRKNAERFKAAYDRKCRELPQGASQSVPVPAAEVAKDAKRIMLPEFNPSYAVSAEAMAAASPSALGLFARDVADDAKNVLLPVVVIGGLTFGALKAVETGDVSTLQRAWAMVR